MTKLMTLSTELVEGIARQLMSNDCGAAAAFHLT